MLQCLCMFSLNQIPQSSMHHNLCKQYSGPQNVVCWILLESFGVREYLFPWPGVSLCSLSGSVPVILLVQSVLPQEGGSGLGKGSGFCQTNPYLSQISPPSHPWPLCHQFCATSALFYSSLPDFVHSPPPSRTLCSLTVGVGAWHFIIKNCSSFWSLF